MIDLRPRGARIAAKALTVVGWLAFAFLVVALISFSCAREGKIWGCW